MSKSDKKGASLSTTASILDQANMVHALAYIPYFIGAVAMYFLGNTDKKQAMHHIKYSAMIAGVAMILILVLKGFFGMVVSVAYLVISALFAYKAYRGEKVEVEILDVIEDKISEKIQKK